MNTIFDIFAEICKVPRPSKHEEQISRWLQDFAAAHGIECIADEAMNIIMRAPATPGYENHKGIILQAHMDMVCEKNSDVQHDFMTDPIQTYIDGEWLKAKGTTLGADNGIGIAMALAAITDPELQHPAIECLFTVDEETGLTGAEKLQDGMLQGEQLINLDSEDDGQVFIDCAGGIDTLAKMHYTPNITNTDGLFPLHRRDQVHQPQPGGEDAADRPDGGIRCQAGEPGHQPSRHLRRFPSGQRHGPALRAASGRQGRLHPGADAGG